MNDAAQAADTFAQAAQLNREDPLLRGCLLRFPDFGQLVVTGDLHGHGRNFERLERYCDLEHAGARHVVLHEIIHEDPNVTGHDRSCEVLLAAAAWKCAFPDQVHFLQSNHELAQLTGHEISKNGRVVTADFEAGLAAVFGAAHAPRVLEAIRSFIRSLPLAGRTAHRVFVAHSVPGPRDLPAFDPAILQRSLTDADLFERGPVHALVWGRYQTEASLEALRASLDADFFICGHQPQEAGYEVLYDRLVILASDHNHGVFLPLDLRKPATLDSLTAAIRPLASLP
ncbi:MAG TPA: hypothetical protein PKK06_08260 [Phycisphaerae bacterium]|nr:hypothetical protein [Phycisphaerae bacterium]HNU43698.1 hypothetical protein [Phycisphaerae bacterium]